MKIMLDPGHGGNDPGASFRGLAEKEITLQIARVLSGMLGHSHYEVRATRGWDEFVPLAARARTANEWPADLYVSIHTNADPDDDAPGQPEATGAEVWAVSPRGKALGGYIGQAFRYTFPGEPWRGVKERGLYVLTHTVMPAVLVETAFIDASDSVRKLTDPRVLGQIAFCILRGILKYEEVFHA